MLHVAAQPPTILADTVRPIRAGTPSTATDIDSLVLSVRYAYALQPEEQFGILPTTLELQYDPKRRRRFDYASTGNLGSPARMMWYAPIVREGFDIGFHQYDIYKLPLDSLRYYRTRRSYTDLAYSQKSQEDFIFKADFSRDLGSQANFGLEYERISHLGYYDHHKSRHTALGLTTHYRSSSGRYRAMVGFAFNEFLQEHNLGVTTDTLFQEGLFDDRTSIPVFSNSAFTTHQETGVAITQHLDVQRVRRDSTGAVLGRKRSYLVTHQLILDGGRYKYTDASPDSIAYGPLLTEDRGLRYLIRTRSVTNRVDLSTGSLRGDGAATAVRDNFTVGIAHTYRTVAHEPRDTTINNLRLTGSWLWRPIPALTLNTAAHFALWDNAGDYKVDSRLTWQVGKLGTLDARLLSQLYAPHYLAHRHYLSSEQLWLNDFSKTLETNLEASYTLPATRTTIGGGYHLISNYIYYDTLALPQQTATVVNVVQLWAQQNLQFGWLHIENLIGLQANDSDVLHLPSFYSEHRLYFRDYLFRGVARTTVGLDVRLSDTYLGDRYQPAVGQFFLQYDEEVGFFPPQVDLYAGLEVQRFSFYFKMENVTAWFIDTPQFILPGYPLYESQFRIGINWRLGN